MLSFTGGLKVLVAVEACDMRKGYEGLTAMVEGVLFVFGNKRRTRLKILYYDGSGVWLLSKRLEKGTFSWPQSVEGKSKLTLRPEALAMLTDGIDLRGARMRAWYERDEAR